VRVGEGSEGGLCASSQPLRQTDPMDIATKLDAIAARLEEARAAAAVIAEGDPSAMAELDAVVDGMAAEIAELKGMTSGMPGS
jgi:hypothetical protein